MKRNYSLRGLILGMTVIALAMGGLMQPFYAYSRERNALNELPVNARILDEYTFDFS